MRRFSSILGQRLALLLTVASCLAPQSVLAAESASYTLQEVGPGHAEASGHESQNYRMRGDITWRQEAPMHSQNFQITTAPVPRASSVASSSVATSAASSSTDDGGHRGDPPINPPPASRGSSVSSRSSLSSESSSSSASTVASSVGSEPLHGAPPAGSGDILCPAYLCPGPFWHPIDLTPGEPSASGALLPMLHAAQVAIATCIALPFSWLLLLLCFLLGVLAAFLLMAEYLGMGPDSRRWFRIAICTLLALLMLVLSLPSAFAAVSSPQRHVYNGHLLDASGDPITDPHSIRFSQWYSRDYQTGDVDGAGAINTLSTSYAGYTEVFTVTPDSNGYFSVVLGTGASLPDLAVVSAANLDNLFLQVEVKPSASANTAYELLDTNTDDPLIDRSPILSVPFAQNADLLDQREIGTGSGSIPILGSGGLLPVATIPGGTNRDTFVIDANDTATTNVTLQFGTSLNETLRYDIVNSRFVFSDDLRVEGDLVVTGLINGIDISSLSSSDGGKLQVSSGAGLTINITGGSYRLNGVSTDYTGDSGVAVTANATNYVFIGSGGLNVRTMAFPTDEAFIRLAEVVTNGTTVTQINDRRIVQSDDRTQSGQILMNAEFQNASYQGDAVDNVGQLSVSLDNISLRNFYLWTSTRVTLQDYDIIVRVSLPEDFARWEATPLSVTYRTTSADAADNTVDISVFDTNGSPVTLGGSATSLASTSWATTDLTYDGTPTWTSGQDFLVRFKLSAKNNSQAHIGSLKLYYVRLTNP